MSVLREAMLRSDRRLAAVIDATQEGRRYTMAAVPMTVAGTDLDGVELREMMEAYARVQVAGAMEQLIADEEVDVVAAVEKAMFGVVNGVSLSWWWAGYEARDLRGDG